MVTKSSKKNALFVKTRINPLFRPLITDILTNHPHSVVREKFNQSVRSNPIQADYVIEWMKNKGSSIENGIVAALEGLEEETNRSSKQQMSARQMQDIVLADKVKQSD